MATGRRLEYSRGFENHLQSLSKRKDQGLPERVRQALTSRLEQGPGNDCRLQRVKDLHVYKMRVPAQRKGKRGGARVVYYCNHELIFALLIFLKSEQADLSPEDHRKQIQDPLQTAGLWPR